MKPCNHPGCRNHVGHPCEKCGYQAGVMFTGLTRAQQQIAKLIRQGSKAMIAAQMTAMPRGQAPDRLMTRILDSIKAGEKRIIVHSPYSRDAMRAQERVTEFLDSWGSCFITRIGAVTVNSTEIRFTHDAQLEKVARGDNAAIIDADGHRMWIDEWGQVRHAAEL